MVYAKQIFRDKKLTEVPATISKMQRSSWQYPTLDSLLSGMSTTGTAVGADILAFIILFLQLLAFLAVIESCICICLNWMVETVCGEVNYRPRQCMHATGSRPLPISVVIVGVCILFPDFQLKTSN